MYLKSIEVNGFKSFANKIVFKFNDGITGIVGPNGSGKSNVGDAVRWVLGEQSAKQLRGAKMEDVIFAGTELRKPQGSAYVAITLDNSDHVLPIDYTEVTVARRVFRSGESEYLINGVTSRLKDVAALFFDTGIGKEGYSIIGQGQIDRILSGKPEEHRELFDEAAGIVKYKKNKAATEKSLESERENLTRVNDILSELERQVGPLKEQSETAKRYLLFKDELKKLDINAFLLDSEERGAKKEELEEKLRIVTDDISRIAGELDAAKESYELIENRIEELSNEIDETKNNLAEKKLDNEKQDGETRLVNEQLRSLKDSEGVIAEQIDSLNKSLAAYKSELDGIFEKKSLIDEQLDDADDVLESAVNAADEIKERIEKAEAEVEDSKSLIIENISEGGALKAKVGRYDTMLENIALRRSELEQRYLNLKSEETRLRAESEESLETQKKLAAEVARLEQTIADSREAIDESAREEISSKNDITVTGNQIIGLRSKKETLRNMSERYEGYGNAIKRVMELKAGNKGLIGVVADIIEVEKKYETAIETALGGSIQNIVTEDEATAKKMIAFLKENKAGRATFLPIESIVIRGGVDEAVKKEQGVVGIASDLVKSDAKFDTILRHLLGRIVVCDNIDNASKLARKYKQSLRIVTLEGEQITPGGAMTGGAFRNSSNLLGRKRELEDIDEQIVKLEKKKKELEKTIEESKAFRENQRAIRDKALAELNQVSVEKNTADIAVGNATERLAEIESTYNKVAREREELKKQIEEINRNKGELEKGNLAKEQDNKRLEERIEELEKQLVKDRADHEEKLAGINELTIKFNGIKQENDFLMANIERIRSAETSAKQSLKSLNDRIAQGAGEAASLSEKLTSISHRIEENNRIISIYEKKLEELKSKKASEQEQHKDFFAKREELSNQMNALDKSSFKLNAQIEKLNEQGDALNDYMWEEYELTLNSALEFKDDTLNDAGSLKKEISEVKSKIKSLGDVNVNAIEDYKEVSERYEFLKNQHDDIVRAEENLVNIIAELDRAMKEQFAASFKDIRLMFLKVFKELFGGGKCELELVDEENILETGIRIIAQPPGKKLQNMMQLSGGEKSLTAIALLFAIQSLKPSPFCLLDEIEAALDDSNVKRYANYLSKLTSDTQFIVITHRKGTMEACDILYGITMQEKGVSTLVSVNMIEDKLDD
ncbi:MAG: chromosome segregation protein SMC [Lachnospiraceae bacterium]|nr:chromosome segregation protein SMC [Lachnospiraceae bacterium]